MDKRSINKILTAILILAALSMPAYAAGETAFYIGNVSALGWVNGSQLCISDDCRAAWPAGGNVSGNGSIAGYIPQWQTSTLLNNSVIFQNGTNIGIGTTSPNYKLDVQGGSINTAGNLIAGGNIWSGTSSGYMGIGNAGPYINMFYDNPTGLSGFGFNLYYNGTNYVYVNVAGWSGTGQILSLNPSSGLFFQRATNGVNPAVLNTLFSVGTTGNVGVVGNLTVSGTGNTTIAGNVGINQTSPQGVLHVSAGGQSNALVVNATTGYVGIGTTAPGTKLDVNGDLNVNGTVYNATWNGARITQTYLSGITIPNTNVTGGWTLPNTNVTGGWTIPEANVTAKAGVSGIAIANLTAGTLTSSWIWNGARISQTYLDGIKIPNDNVTGGWTIPEANVTAKAGVSNIAVANLTAGTLNSASWVWNGARITQGYLDGITIPAANVTAGTFPAGSFAFQNDLTVSGNIFVIGNLTNTNMNNLSVNASISPPTAFDNMFDLGTGARRWRYGYFGTDVTVGGYSVLTSNSAAGGAASGTFSSLTLKPNMVNIVQANITSGITIPNSNVTGGWTIPEANVTAKAGVSGIAVANLTAGTLGAGWTWQGTRITQTYLDGISIPEANVTNKAGVSGIAVANLTAGTLTSSWIWNGARITQTYLDGISIPAANITAGSFPTGLYTFPGGTNFTGAVNLATGGGNVGIGTTGPTVPLEVVGTSGNTAIRISGTGINYLDADGLRIAGSDTGNTIWAGGNNIGITANSGQDIFLSQTSAQTTGLTVKTATGNVGIGTTSPNGKLEVAGAGVNGIVVSGTVEPGLRLNNSAYSMYDIFSGGGGSSAYNDALTFFKRSGSGTPKVVFDSSVGNVIIGTTSGNEKLSVTGNASFTGLVDMRTNNIINAGTITATTFSGAGTSLTGNATALNIGGNAVTAGTTAYATNADTVDGYHANNTPSFGTVDGSTVRETKGQLTHFSTYTMANKPPGMTYPYHLQVTDGSKGFEIAADWISTDGPSLMARSLRDCCQNWSSWITIWTNLSDGSGSGLDADLLDNQHGSYYLNTGTSFAGDVSGTYGALAIGTDKVTAAMLAHSIDASGIGFNAATATTAGSITSGVTIPEANVTNKAGVSGIAVANLTAGTFSGTSWVWNGARITQTYLDGITLPHANITNWIGVTIPEANVTAKAGVSGIAVANLTAGTLGAGWTWQGNRITQTYLDGISIPEANVTAKAGVSGLSASNITGDLTSWNYKIQLSPNNVSGVYNFSVGLGKIPTANVTGGWTLPNTNVTGGWTIPEANVTAKAGVSGIAVANLTAGTFTSSWIWQGARITQTYLDGITIPNTNVTGGWTIPEANVTAKAGVSGIAVANLTAGTLGAGWTWQGTRITQTYLDGISIPAANVTAGSFPTGLYTFPGGTNFTGAVNLATGGSSVGIGTTSPAEKLEVNGNARISAGSFEADSYLYLGPGTSNGIGMNFVTGSTNSYYTDALFGAGSGGNYSAFRVMYGATEVMRANADSRVGIGTTSPQTKLHLTGQQPAFRIDSDSSPFTDARLQFKTNYGNWSVGASLGNVNGYFQIVKGIDTTDTKLTIDNNGNVGIGTTSPNEKLSVSGNFSVTGLADFRSNIRLASGAHFYGGGADIAEKIETTGQAEAGDVVMLDAEHPGKIVKSSLKQTKLVAGVVSTNPGIILGTNTTGTDLAVAGRVPAKVNDENGAIAVGDLLVTSSTAGEAMRCTENCQGAILGKAMEPLAKGHGVIDVLVTIG